MLRAVRRARMASLVLVLMFFVVRVGVILFVLMIVLFLLLVIIVLFLLLVLIHALLFIFVFLLLVLFFILSFWLGACAAHLSKNVITIQKALT